MAQCDPVTGYKRASELLGSRVSKRIGRETYLKREDDSDGSIVCRYWGKEIARYYPNGDIRLDSAGYKTVTTKDRLNQVTPIRVWSNRGVWFIRYEGKEYPFADGMLLHENGTVSGEGADPKAERKAMARVRAFSKRFVAKLQANEIDAPGAGDCGFCTIFHRDGNGDSHIKDHIKENYYVPSLLVRAMEWRSSQAMKWVVQARFNHEPVESGNGFFSGGFLYKEIEKTLSRYIARQLGLAA